MLLPLEGFRITFEEPNLLDLAEAEITVDGTPWGSLPIRGAQARLEAEGDFAIVMLKTRFASAGRLGGLLLEVNSEGQRNLSLDRAYLVPARSDGPPDSIRFRMPEPLIEGEHDLGWSYAWTPPRDRATGAPLPAGVTLRPPRIVGAFLASANRLQAVPENLDLRSPGSFGLDRAARVAFFREIAVPPGARSLHLEGPPPGALRISVDDVELVPVGDAPYLCRLVPGTQGQVTLRLTWSTNPVPIRLLRLLS